MVWDEPSVSVDSHTATNGSTGMVVGGVGTATAVRRQGRTLHESHDRRRGDDQHGGRRVPSATFSATWRRIGGSGDGGREFIDVSCSPFSPWSRIASLQDPAVDARNLAPRSPLRRSTSTERCRGRGSRRPRSPALPGRAPWRTEGVAARGQWAFATSNSDRRRASARSQSRCTVDAVTPSTSAASRKLYPNPTTNTTAHRCASDKRAIAGARPGSNE